MKKALILLTALVLTLSVFTGCGCTRRDAGMDTRPSTEMTVLPTNIPETTAPLLPETEAPTVPATEAPTDGTKDEGISDDAANGTGATGDATNSSESATEGARNRMR